MNGYRSGPRFGFLGLLVGLIFLGIVGVVAYNIGVSAGAASAGAATTTAPFVYGPWYGFGFGFPIFGFFFFLLIIGLLFAAFSRRGWGHRGWYGGYGPGPWGHRDPEMRDVPPPFEPMLESWHRRAHGEAPSGSAGDRPDTQS